jgi:hypothetical protein
MFSYLHPARLSEDVYCDPLTMVAVQLCLVTFTLRDYLKMYTVIPLPWSQYNIV